MQNQHPERVAVAMSGGVDSSVAAALLVESGYEVLGFTLRLGSRTGEWEATRACCGLSEVHDARRSADRLGIPHYILDHGEQFEQTVIRDFVDEYARGRTPNPCVRCNQHVKFATFLDQALAFGCQWVATGHYARIGRNETSGRYTLRRGRDAGKDQSYVLYPLTQEQMAKVLLPLGELTKPQVREQAKRFGLPTADKAESQEICFVADDAYAEFVARRRPEAARPGPILNAAGATLGTHRGLVHYTVGQRRHLDLGGAERLYVAEILPEQNALVVADAEHAGRRRFRVEQLHWVSIAGATGGLPASADRDAAENTGGQAASGTRADAAAVLGCLVQVRYRMAPLRCRLFATGDRAEVELAEPCRGIAPGQAAVCYNDDGYVLAGGTIAHVASPAEGSGPT